MNRRAQQSNGRNRLGFAGFDGGRARRGRRLRNGLGPLIEGLEDRTLLSTLDITSGALQYNTTTGASNLDILIDASTLFFSDSAQPITLGAGAIADGWFSGPPGLAFGPASSVSSMLIGGNSTGGQALALNYTAGDPLPAAGLTFAPAAAAAGLSNALELIPGIGAATTFSSESFTPSSAASGTITYSTSSHSNVPITFSNVPTPLRDLVPSSAFTFNSPSGAPYTFLNVGPVVANMPTTNITDNNTNSFQEYDFANKTVATINNNNSGAVTTMFDNPAQGLTDTYINAMGGGEAVFLEATPAGTTTHVDMGSASGSFTQTGSHAHLFSSILGNVDVQSTGGSNTVQVIDQGETSGQTYSIAGSKITATSSPATVDFSGGGISTVIVDSAGRGDLYKFTGPVQSDVTTYDFDADGGPGPNTLDVNSSVAPLTYATAGVLGFGAGNPFINYTNFQAINVTKPATAPAGTGVTITANEGQALSNAVVATFTNPDLANTSANYVASINWGDSMTSAGTIVPDGTGGYQVTGSHTYAASGSYTVDVTLTDQGSVGSTLVGNTTINVTSNGPVLSNPNPIVSTANIATAPLTAQGVTIKGREGTALNPAVNGDVLVGTFMDTGTVGATTAYTASISWGDGSTSAATRITSQGTPNGVVFSVYGNYTYAEVGTYPVNVTITKTASGATAIAASQAVIADAPLTAGASVTLNTNSGVLLSNMVVGSFTDANTLTSSTGDFTATINWGDGSPATAGTITGAAGSFNVEGTHAYARAGSFTTSIVVHDVDGASVSLSGTAAVTDRALTNAATFPVSAVENINTGTVVLATFTDPNPLDTGSGVSATVDWGDGTGTLPAVVTLVGTSGSGSTFQVTGHHTYTTPGSDTVSITVTTLGGATTAPSPLVTTATVADATITASGTSITGIEGNSTGNVVIATFLDADPASTGANFTSGNGSIKVNWGDGTGLHTLPPSALTSSGTPNGVLFTVTAAFTYPEAGHYQVTVAITDTGGATASANGQATIADAALTAGASVTLMPNSGVVLPGTTVVGSFTDANTLTSSTGDFTATINWGDGSPATAGTIVSGGAAGSFNVEGTHAYARAGSYATSIVVHDVDGSVVTLTGTATVTDRSLISAKTYPVSAVENINTGTVVLATFTDPNPLDTGSGVSATVDWGDGTGTLPAVVTFIGTGPSGSMFQVSGNHVYTTPGTDTVSITVTTLGGATTVPSPLVTTATVADATITASGTSITGIEGNSTGNVVIATFLDADPASTVTNFTSGNGTIKVNWGDGTGLHALPPSALTSSGTPNGVLFTVTAAFTYLEAGHYQVTVAITDTGGATASANGQATIADAALTAGASVTLMPSSGVVLPSTTVVGSFTDANTLTSSPGDFTATINWGDGSPATAGTITGAAGSFNVEGTHAYVKAGSYAMTIVVHDVDGSVVTLTGTATVADRTLTSAITYPVAAVENINTGTILLATFTDPNPLDTASGISATVTWGDNSGTFPAFVTLVGTSSSGSIFEVTGNHTYTTPGSYTVSVTVTTLGGATTSPSPLTTTATVADATITASGTSISGIEGNTTGDVVIATFLDADPGATVANFTTGNGSIKVNWGEGTGLHTLPASALTSSGTPNGVLFTVTRAFTYAEAGHYQVTVLITDTDGSTASANGEAVIADAALAPSATQPTVSTTEDTLFSGVVGSFTDANPKAPTTDFTYVTINWGDGSPNSNGTISQPGGAGTAFLVSGTHEYTDAGVNGGIGHYPITIDVHDIDGSTTTIANRANVADVVLTVTGKLNPASDSGVSHTDNITNVVQPNFIGTTNQPDATVNLYAQVSGSSTPVLIGQGVSNSNGAWSITSTQALADGAYTITAIATDASGHTVSSTTTIVANLVIDTVGPKVTSVLFNRFHGQIVVTYQDYGGVNNAGVGLNMATVIDSSNYQLITVHHPRVGKYRVNVITDVPGTTSGTQTVTLSINGGHYIRGGWYFFTIYSASLTHVSGVQDIAGNALDGEFHGYFPSGNNVRGGDFVAQLSAIHHTIFAPSTVVGRATPVSPPGTRQGKVHVGATFNPSKQPKQLSAKERYAHKIASQQAHPSSTSTGSTPAISAGSEGAGSATPSVVDQAITDLVSAKHRGS